MIGKVATCQGVRLHIGIQRELERLDGFRDAVPRERNSSGIVFRRVSARLSTSSRKLSPIPGAA